MAVLSSRDKSILVGLYLSKFDKAGLQSLGFSGVWEAYNTLAYTLGTVPNTIKAYRDEFDPYFPNGRVGRRNRPIRAYCKKVLDDYSSLDLQTFTDLINSFVYEDFEIDKFIAGIEKRDFSASIEKRLLTGIAAENYFQENYRSIAEFSQCEITDTTKKACGFDFKLDSGDNFFCVEVKGLNASKGNIGLTEKEYSVADNLQSKYCLYVVSNFIKKPQSQWFFDPLNSALSFSKTERHVLQTIYTAQV